ncbi:MAG: electron transport complex subunit RsxE [Thermoplasmata archaeon]|nr:electron transport complex subunit RsxE [Thermoplasmata archaeon]
MSAGPGPAHEHVSDAGGKCAGCGVGARKEGSDICHTCFTDAQAREVASRGRAKGDGLVGALKKGITATNPVFILFLGLCPTLAVSTSIDNAVGMSAAVMSVLIGSNIIIASVRKWVPDIVRIPIFIVIIATFVTIIDLSMQAFVPPLSRALGIYVPLITVNCIILGRAEAYASKNSVKGSLYDAIGIGFGFLAAILLVSTIRQTLGTGMIEVFGARIAEVPGLVDYPMAIFILPMGAFLVISLLLATFRYLGVMKCE